MSLVHRTLHHHTLKGVFLKVTKEHVQIIIKLQVLWQTAMSNSFISQIWKQGERLSDPQAVTSWTLCTLYPVYYATNKVLLVLDDYKAPNNWGQRHCSEVNLDWVDRRMLTCCNTAIHSPELDSSRQIHLARNKTTSGDSVWGKAPFSQRDEETKPQNMTSLKYECPWPNLYLLAQGLHVTPGV